MADIADRLTWEVSDFAIRPETAREAVAEIHRLQHELANTRHSNEQYSRLADYCIEHELYKGHDGSHVDSILRLVAGLQTKLDAFRKLYDDTPRHKDAPDAYDFISLHNRMILEHRKEIDRLQAERDDHQVMLGAIAGRLGVDPDPRQTFDDRLLQAVDGAVRRLGAAEKARDDWKRAATSVQADLFQEIEALKHDLEQALEGRNAEANARIEAEKRLGKVRELLDGGGDRNSWKSTGDQIRDVLDAQPPVSRETAEHRQCARFWKCERIAEQGSDYCADCRELVAGAEGMFVENQCPVRDHREERCGLRVHDLSEPCCFPPAYPDSEKREPNPDYVPSIGTAHTRRS